MTEKAVQEYFDIDPLESNQEIDIDLLSENIRKQLIFGQYYKKKSVTSYLPFPYHWIPGEIRMYISRILFHRNRKALRCETSRFPASYVDNTTDVEIANFSANISNENRWTWPNNKSCALVLSHDTDTAGQEKGIAILREIAERRGLRSTFSFVGDCISSYKELIADLKMAGHDVALHDMHHDNTVAFLSHDQIIDRLTPILPKVKELGLTGFRSPSWYVSPDLWNSLGELGFDYDISGLDTWPYFEINKNYGLATFHPFMVGPLVVMPNTIPFEVPIGFGFRKKMLEFWKPKFDRIAHEGGLIMFNAHPDRWYSGNKRIAAQFERCIDYILETYDAALVHAADLAQHVQLMKKNDAMISLNGEPELSIPLFSQQTMSIMNNKIEYPNPIHISKREFLQESK